MKSFVRICSIALMLCMVLSFAVCAFAAESSDTPAATTQEKENKWGNPKSYIAPTVLFAFGIGGGMAIGGAMNRKGRK